MLPWSFFTFFKGNDRTYECECEASYTGINCTDIQAASATAKQQLVQAIVAFTFTILMSLIFLGLFCLLSGRGTTSLQSTPATFGNKNRRVPRRRRGFFTSTPVSKTDKIFDDNKYSTQ